MKNNSIPQAGKRAAIYVRVSTERQAEQASPEAQEADCLALCKAKGYEVVEVYRETEKYRVRGRLVEPSGTRSDRPQWLRMLADYDAGCFDLLVAWRDDRLFRGIISATIALRDRMKGRGLRVELISGNLDLQTMEILAWAAGRENEARSERRTMGMHARFAAGKVCFSNPIYGYAYDATTGVLEIKESEARWVRAIFDWRSEGTSRAEIRRRLITAGADQGPFHHKTRKYQWSLAIIDAILVRAEYHTGVYRTKFDGISYETTIPILIDSTVAQTLKERRAAWKRWPAGNYRTEALAAGHIYCAACGTRMQLVGCNPILANGERKVYYYYQCKHYVRGQNQPGCVGRIRQDAADTDIWARIWHKYSKPEVFAAEIQELVEQAKTEDAERTAKEAEFRRQLEDLKLSRKRLASALGKGIFEEDDVKEELESITKEEKRINHELNLIALKKGNRAQRLLELAELHRQQVQERVGTGWGEYPEDVPFAERRQIVEAVSLQAKVVSTKPLKIGLLGEMDFPSLAIPESLSGRNIDDLLTFSVPVAF